MEKLLKQREGRREKTIIKEEENRKRDGRNARGKVKETRNEIK